MPAKKPKKKVVESRNPDEEIIILVNNVRKTQCPQSFIIIKEHLESYIKMFGKKYRIPGCDSDEIEQECLVALRFKAIEDFNPERGKFKTFAILCIKRHLYSLIKGNNQLKRRVLNTSISLNQDRIEEGESVSLASLIMENGIGAVEQLLKNESSDCMTKQLYSKLSKLEQEVFKLYLQQLHYNEIEAELKKIFPDKKLDKKAVDNSLVRIRNKAQSMTKNQEFFEE